MLLRLLDLQPSPIVQLNRAIGVSKVHGAKAGLAVLTGPERDRALRDYGLLHAVSAQLHWEPGDQAAAANV